MKRAISLLLGTALLGGCASSTLLSKPIETQGKALTSASTTIGSSASNYKTATRLNLLMGSRASNFQQGEIGFRVISDLSHKDESQYKPAIQYARDSLICYPLAASQIRQQNSTALTGLGKSLSQVAGESPTTIIGLLATLDKDYAVTIPGASNTNIKSEALKLVCQNVYEEATSSTTDNDPDYKELDQINYNAFRNAKPTEKTSTIGINSLADTVKIIGEIFTGVTKRIDQAKRNAALKKFYEDPKNTGKIKTEIQGLDQAIRVAELGNRLVVKEAFLAALTRYRLAAQNVNPSTRLGHSPKLLEAANDLLKASNDLDDVILARMREHLSTDTNLLKIYVQTTKDPILATTYFKTKNAHQKATGNNKNIIKEKLNILEKKIGDALPDYQTKYQLYRQASANLPTNTSREIRSSDTNKVCRVLDDTNITCLQSNLGQNLLTTHQHTADIALRKWKNFTKEEKIAFWESVFATTEELKTLNNNLAAFENDKASFVILNDFLDGFKKDP